MKRLLITLLLIFGVTNIQANIFKKAVHWVEKEAKKAGEWAKDAVEDIEKKFKQYGQAAVDAIKDIGEDAWNEIRKASECVEVVKYGTLYAEEKAAYEASKALLHTLGSGAQVLGNLSSEAMGNGVNIESMSFEAIPMKAFKPGKALDFTMKGKVFGQSIDIDAEVDFKQIKNLEELAKQALNQIF